MFRKLLTLLGVGGAQDKQSDIASHAMGSEEYLNELEQRCKKSADYFYDSSSNDGPKIGIFGFDNYPAPGQFTYFTYGLHRLGKPEWTHGVPEYFIVIDSPNRSFAEYFGYLVSTFAFEKTMNWSTLIGIGEEDAVEGYPYRWLALAPPAYLDWENYKFTNKEGLPINFGMGYFISNNDFETVKAKGMYYLKDKMEEDYEYWKRIQKA